LLLVTYVKLRTVIGLQLAEEAAIGATPIEALVRAPVSAFSVLDSVC
jgi:hypothetical protein